MKKVIVAGAPRCGKTRLADQIGQRLGLRHEQVAHTDDLVGVLSWSASSEEAARWIADDDLLGAHVLEGTAASRAARKFMLAHTGRPCLVFVHLMHPFVALSEGQRRMGLGCQTVFNEIRPELVKRGVVIVEPVATAVSSCLDPFVVPGLPDVELVRYPVFGDASPERKKAIARALMTFVDTCECSDAECAIKAGPAARACLSVWRRRRTDGHR